MNDCVFCKIISGDEPRFHVWEDEHFVMFLTHRPINAGHTLIIPKQHVDYYFDLDKNLYLTSFDIARWYEPVLKKVSGADRIGLAVEGYGVAHAHLHAIPLFHRGDLFARGGHEVSPNELEVTATELRQELSKQ